MVNVGHKLAEISHLVVPKRQQSGVQQPLAAVNLDFHGVVDVYEVDIIFVVVIVFYGRVSRRYAH